MSADVVIWRPFGGGFGMLLERPVPPKALRPQPLCSHKAMKPLVSNMGWSLGILGWSWGILGPSWGDLGAVLGRSWGILGPSWGALGPSWGHRGALLPTPQVDQKQVPKCKGLKITFFVTGSCQILASEVQEKNQKCQRMSLFGGLLGVDPECFWKGRCPLEPLDPNPCELTRA